MRRSVNKTEKLFFIEQNLFLSTVFVFFFLSKSVFGQEKNDTIQLDFWDDFVISLKITDTIHDTPDLYIGTKRGIFLIVDIDSVLRAMNTGIYNDSNDLKKIKYLAVPIGNEFNNPGKRMIMVVTQQSIEYIEYSKIAFGSNPVILDVDLVKSNGFVHRIGLGKRIKSLWYWRVLYRFGLISENKYFTDFKKSKRQSKDPNLKYIERYEKEQQRKQRNEERSRKTK